MKGLAFLLKFSYRNLGRVPKRTFIMILSLSIGCGFIIWDLNFSHSGSKEVMKEFLSQYAGQFHITHKDYYNLDNKKLFNNYKTISDEQIEDKSIFEKSTRRITAPVFISGEKKTLGVLLTGMDVDKEKSLSTIHTSISEGRFLDPLGQKEIIVGKKFAERIEVKLGDQVVVIGQALDGSVANDLLTVVGVMDFGGGELEEALAFTQFSTAQELIVVPEGVYHQRVSFDFSQEVMPQHQKVTATKWDDLLPEIGVSVRFIDRLTWFVGVIIVLVISLGLSNTLMITFFEREQEFQSLNIIGAKTTWITASLMIEVFIMGTIAIILGTLIGHAATIYCHYHPINLQLFTGGKNIIMGGLTIQPLIRLHPVNDHYWQVPLMIYAFLSLTMIYPLIRVIRRSTYAL